MSFSNDFSANFSGVSGSCLDVLEMFGRRAGEFVKWQTGS